MLEGPNPVLHVRPKDGWKPKTGDIRAIPLSPRAVELLGSLSRHSKWVLTAPPRPSDRKGQRQISERRLLLHLKRLLARIGLPGHLHTFRFFHLPRRQQGRAGGGHPIVGGPRRHPHHPALHAHRRPHVAELDAAAPRPPRRIGMHCPPPTGGASTRSARARRHRRHDRADPSGGSSTNPAHGVLEDRWTSSSNPGKKRDL